MRLRSLGVLKAFAVAVALVPLVGVAVAGQTPATKSKTADAATKWTAPRTVDGQPDLQGVWANNNATPLERPAAWAGKLFLNDAEVAQLKKIAAEIQENDGDAQFGDGLLNAALERNSKPGSYDSTGNYNQFWIVDRDFDDRRTALITDPPDGKIPAMTPVAEKRLADVSAHRKVHPADGPEDRPLSERCVSFGVPRIGAGYNSYFQVFQAKDYVAILGEHGHELRVIPLDGRPHVKENLRLWNGDSRGRWEGDTLVVETTNYSPKSEFRAARERLHVTERFTRVGPNTLNWELTFDDPTTWSKPWTMMIPLKHSKDPIFEYACHEGNESMIGILSGHRAQEREASAKAGSK